MIINKKFTKNEPPKKLDYASDELKADKEVVIAAVETYPAALRFAHEKLQNDDDLISAGGEV